MHRVEVRLKHHLPDARGLGITKDIHDLGITTVSNVRVVDIYWLDADLIPDVLELVCRQLLADPVTEEYWYQGQPRSEKAAGADFHTVEVAYNPGVTEPVEDSVIKALRDLAVGEVRAVKTAHRYLIEGRLDNQQLEAICSKLLVNPIIQHIVKQERLQLPENPKYTFKLIQADVQQAGRQLGFTDDELETIAAYFRKEGRNPTDVEMETLAQTWSEHCVHKTFKGRIKFGQSTIDNLLKSTIMKATKELDKSWCLSVFSDNAGVIDFDGRYALCFKVETHNHPSAIEPYGGAATGMGGVVRDPLGTGMGAKPIANTDVFCFAPPRFPP